jgi:hypothetical protein
MNSQLEDPLETSQIPSPELRAAMRRNPEIQLRYTFGDRKFAMDGRPLSDFADFEINLKPVPRQNAKDIRAIAKVYKKVMADPEVQAMADQERKSNFCMALVMLGLLTAAVYFWA